MMDTNPPTYSDIVEIMNKVQRSTACHEKYKTILVHLEKKFNADILWMHFERIVMILLHKDPKLKNLHVEQSVKFCALFFTSTMNSDNAALFRRAFDFLLDLHDLANDVARFRVCQMISECLDCLVGSDLDEDIVNRIENIMLQRLRDHKSQVRFEAIRAIYRLQDPEDPDCKIISELLLRMNKDRRVKVRKICVEKICIRRDTVAALSLRMMDVNEDVRLAAFTRATKLFKYFKIVERHEIIRSGSLDSSEQIRNYVAIHMIPAWLSECDYNYLSLLKAMRLDATEKLVQDTTKVIECIMKALLSKGRPFHEFVEMLNLDNSHVVPYEDLNWESIIFWRCLVDNLQEANQFEPFHNIILPDLVDFVTYIWIYCKRNSSEAVENSLEFQFILSQLFTITLTYDLSDTVSRQALNELATNIFRTVHLTPTVATVIMKNLERSMPSVQHLERFVCELISDIVCPMEDNIRAQEEVAFKVANLKLQVNCLMEREVAAVKEQEYSIAAECKRETTRLRELITELNDSLKTAQVVVRKTDGATMLKCLTVARALLFMGQVSKLDSTLQALQDDLIIGTLTHEDGHVRCSSLECYTLCCIISEKSARLGMPIFYANLLMEEHNVEVLLVAIGAVSDLLVLYGPGILNSEETAGTVPLVSITEIVQMLVNFMDSENPAIQERAGQGLCYLILYRNICSASLISRMLLKWCNPALDGESERLRQVIGMMLEELPKTTELVSLLVRAVLPTIKTLLMAPSTSPLSEVNVPELVKFMVALCDVCSSGYDAHQNLAVAICGKIRDDPTNVRLNQILSKTLLMLNLTNVNSLQAVDELDNICQQLRDDVRNQIVLNNIVKFTTCLDLLRQHNLTAIAEE